MKTDKDLALAFFRRLKERGFGVSIEDFGGRVEGDEGFDYQALSIELLDADKKRFASFDFLGGEFYRISAHDSTGWYGDEVDLKKYC